jgi:hypothetical protein
MWLLRWGRHTVCCRPVGGSMGRGGAWDLRWFTVAIIRLSISYASSVWWHGCQTASTKRRLSRIKRYACLEITGAIRTTPTGDMETLTGLPPLDLVMQCMARSATLRLWSPGCSSYHHPSRGHSSILTRLQKSDTIFNLGVNVMRPVFNLEPKYRVAMLTRQKWSRGPGTLPAVKGLVWFTDRSRTAEGTGAGVCGQSVGRKLSISLGKHATVFQAEVYAILACVHEIETQDRPDKYVSVADRQASLKALVC